VSVFTLILLALALGFALAGVVVGFRAWRRRRDIDRRRLASLGTVDAHRERYR
jgi:hypothetical protein